MANAGTVVIDFAAETAKFTAELKQVRASLKNIEGDMQSVRRVADAALRVATGGVFMNLARQAFEAASATATAAERAGIAVDTFSRLQYAANQTDTEMSALTDGVQKLQLALSSASMEGREAQVMLARWNLEATKLRGLSIEDQLGTIADEFNKLTSAEDRTRFAVEVFGKSAGPQLIPFLAQGRDGIRELTQEADRLGVTLDQTTAEGLEHADKAIKQLTATTSAWTAKFFAGLSIALLGPPDEALRISDRMTEIQGQIASFERSLGSNLDKLPKDAPVIRYIEKLRAELKQLDADYWAVIDKRAAASKPAANTPSPAASSLVQPIDIAPIRAMKIEVNDLAQAYDALDLAVRKIQERRLEETADIAADAYADARLEIERRTTADIENELRIRNDLAARAREEQYAQEVAYEDSIATLKRLTTENTLAALQAFSGQSENIAIALTLIAKKEALVQAIVAGRVAIMKAAASAPFPANLPAVAWATALTAANVAAIAATTYGQVRQIQAAGGAPAGSPANPIYTTPSSAVADQPQQSKGLVEIHFEGDFFGSRDTIDYFISQIREATDGRDVLLFGPGSRQAQEILGQ